MPASQASEKTASTVVGRMASAPIPSGDYDRDVGAFSKFWLQGLSYLDGLPDRAKRSETEQADAAASLSEARQARRHRLESMKDVVGMDSQRLVRRFRGHVGVAVPIRADARDDGDETLRQQRAQQTRIRLLVRDTDASEMDVATAGLSCGSPLPSAASAAAC